MKRYLIIVSEEFYGREQNSMYAYDGDDILHAIEQFQDDPYFINGVNYCRSFEVLEVENESHLWNVANEARKRRELS